jgi:hypothetical protein
MDIYHRIIDWEQGGPALLMHCDIQNNATPLDGYGLIDDLGGWHGLILDSFIDSSKHEHRIHVDVSGYWSSMFGWNPLIAEGWVPQVGSGGIFDNCVRGRMGSEDTIFQHHEAFNFGVDDFTIDFWAKGTHLGNFLDPDYGTDLAIYLRYPSVTSTVEFGINGLFRSDARLYLKVHYGVEPSVTTYVTEGTTNLTGSDGVWHHCALVRVWDTLYMYLDGVLDGQMIIGDSANFESYVKQPGEALVYSPRARTTLRQLDDFHSVKLDAISDYSGSSNEEAYIDEIRVIKGAQWTENFTPPVEPYS